MSRHTFGRMLRTYRRNCTDPEKGGSLTQGRFLDLLSIEMGIAYSNSTASNWERGESRPRINERETQVGIVKVLHDYGALTSPDEADELLAAGNYSALDKEEKRRVFPDWPEKGEINGAGDNLVAQEGRNPSRKGAWNAVYQAVLDAIFYPDELGYQMWAEEVGGTGTVSVPYILEQLVSRVLRRVTSRKILFAVLWIALWLLSWWLTFPLLRWPFSSQRSAWLAAALFTIGALLVPVGVGTLSYIGRADEFRRERQLAATACYLMYMGAFAGFHLGYFFALFVMALAYYAGVSSGFWLELFLSPVPVLAAFVVADQVPFHYRLTSGSPVKLNGGDRAILLLFILYSLLFGVAVAVVHPWLQQPEIGLSLSLTGIGVVALTHVAEGRIERRLLPLLVVGLFALLFVLAQGQTILGITLITSGSAAVAVAVWKQNVRAEPLTLLLLLALAVASGLLFLANAQLPAWLVLAGLVAVVGWSWQRGTVRLPLSLVAIIILAVASFFMAYRGHISETVTSIILIAATTAFLWLELRDWH